MFRKFTKNSKPITASLGCQAFEPIKSLIPDLNPFSEFGIPIFQSTSYVDWLLLAIMAALGIILIGLLANMMQAFRLVSHQRTTYLSESTIITCALHQIVCVYW